MPRTIRSRSANGLSGAEFYSVTGHTEPFFDVVSNIVSTAVDYTTQNIKNQIDDSFIPDGLTVEEASILDDLGITSTIEVVVSNPNQDSGSNAIVLDNNFVDNGTLTINIPGNNIEIPNNNLATIIDNGSTGITDLVTNESLIEMSLLESLYNDFIKPYKEESPYHIGSIQQMTEIYESIDARINNGDSNSDDVRLLIYRDILEVLTMARDVYTDRVRTDREICIVRIKYYEMKTRVNELLQELAECNGSAVSRFCGSLGITLRKPKPLIYAQAILNINMAWYIFLHGTPIKPREYAATVAYVNSLGGKQPAYDKLIELLDERYRDDEQEFNDQAQETVNNTNSSNQDTSSGPCTGSDTGSSGQPSSSDCTCSEITDSAGSGASCGPSSNGNLSDYSSGDECKTITIVETNKLQPVYRPLAGGNISAFVVPGSLDVSIVDNPAIRPQTYVKSVEKKSRRKKRHRSDCRKTLKKCDTVEYVHNSKAVYRPMGGTTSVGLCVPGVLEVEIVKSKYWGMRKKTIKHSSGKRKSKKRRFRKCQFAYYCNKIKNKKNKSCKKKKPSCSYICVPKMDCNDLGTSWGFVVPGSLNVEVKEGFMRNCR